MNPPRHPHLLLPQQQQPLITTPNSCSSLKTRFALRFLQSLKKIRTLQTKTQNPSSFSSITNNNNNNGNLTAAASSSSSSRRRRGRRVKFAADVSMASLIGSRRVWSRTVIAELRRRKTTTTTTTHATTTTTITTSCQKRKKKIKMKMKKRIPSYQRKVGIAAAAVPSRENQLRKLVPGGSTMDACTLLDETAHYMECLATQVMVMRNLVDFCTSSSTTSPSP